MNISLILDDLCCANNSPMEYVAKQISYLAPRNGSVLITGESGSGKEVIAHRLHFSSKTPDGPFVAVNCGSLPPNLIGSELFGYQKGAFTGADREHPGKIRLAQGGTLFLDEIAELPLESQATLLRVLQEKKVCPLGGELEEDVDFRLVCATHRNLQEEMMKGNFRSDLYYRIAVFELELPPLRKRLMDVPLLADKLWMKIQNREQSAEKPLNSREKQILQKNRWPGNIRQLANVLERYLAFRPFGENLENLLPAGPKPETPIDLGPELLKETLYKNGYNQSRSARSLGLSRGAFLHRLKKWGISPKREKIV